MSRVLLLISFVVVLQGCSSNKVASESYTVRGQITAMAKGSASKEIEIHHETIPTFRDRQGKVTGMHSMTMPFAVSGDVRLASFAVDDKVTATFEVVWSDRVPLHLTRLEKLPADTALTLE